MVGKLFKAGMSVVLAVGLSVPLAACQQGQKVSSVEVENESDDNRWADFDDGSEVLSLDTPFFHSNADELNFNVTLEQGTLARDVDAADVTLSGALDGWQVDSAGRADDVTIAVKASRPEGLANNGASVAMVELACDAVLFDGGEKDLSFLLEETTLTDEEIDASGSEQGSDANGSSDIVLNKNDDATDEDIAALEEFVEWSSQEDAPAEHDDDAVAATYLVAAMFVEPTLTIDFDRSQLDGTTFKALLLADDFAFSDDLSAKSFALEGADGCAIADVRRVSGAEAEVSISLPAENGLDTLKDAVIILKAEANESQANVVCLADVPEPRLAIAFDFSDEKAGEVAFTAELHDAVGSLTTENVSVTVDGKDVQPKALSPNSDDTYSVTLDASAVSDDAVVVIEVQSVKDKLGQEANVAPAATLVDLQEDRGILDYLGVSATDDILLPLGKKGLSALADYGWQQLCKNVVDPGLETSLYDTTTNELLAEIVKVQTQLNNISTQINELSNTVVKGQNATIINDAQGCISRISGRTMLLSNEYAAICKQTDPAKRKQALVEFSNRESNRVCIDNIATDLNVLYNIIMKASSADNRDLITVYDDLMAQSYNWGAQTYMQRRNFRGLLASVWTNAAQIVELAYGSEDDEAKRRTNYLDLLDTQTKNVSKLINETHAIDSNVYTHKTGVSEDASAEASYYCNTTGRWYAASLGKNSATKWTDPFAKPYGNRKNGGYRASTPFAVHDARYSDDPSKSFDFRKNGFPAETPTYATTAEVKAMLQRLPAGQTLDKELLSVGFSTAKYLITSEQLESSGHVGFHDNNWNMDTFEVAKATATSNAFTSLKTHFKATVRNGKSKKNKYRTKSWTDPADMFVLKYVSVK